MQHVPALAADGVGAEQFVAGRAPDIGAHAVLFRENLLRLQRRLHDRAAAKNVRLDFFAVRAGLEFIQALSRCRPRRRRASAAWR